MEWLTFDPLPALVLAHVLYGVPRRPTKGTAAITLHNGDVFTDLDRPPRPERLRGVRVVSDASVVPLDVVAGSSGEIAVDVSHVPPPAWLVAETEPAFIELEPAAFTRYLAHEGLAHVIAARADGGASGRPGREIYSKHAKTALGDESGRITWNPGPVGLPVEIVPGGEVALGDRLDLLALVHGRPAAGLEIQIHHRRDEGTATRLVTRLRTDGRGTAACTIDGAGLWRLHTIAMALHETPADADWRSLWASVTFRI